MIKQKSILFTERSLSEKKRNYRKDSFRKLEIYDILQKQPEVAKKQIQVGGRILDKTVYSCQKEGEK